MIKAFERVFGRGSGTAENLTNVSNALTENASALRDDGSGGFFAFQVTTAQLDAAYPDTPGGHETYSAVVPEGKYSNALILNKNHPARFSQPTLKHEPNHHFGRIDQRHDGFKAYINGVNSGQKNAYKNLPTQQRLVNPDHLARIAR